MSLPGNYTTGQQFTAANENAVEAAVNADTVAIAALAAKPVGMLAPVQGVCRGDETFTISGGSVTQITGISINAGSFFPAVGDRILIVNAPASTGTGTIFASTTQPGNGVYVVTSNTTNLSLSRASDMSGSVNPGGLQVYNENASGWELRSPWVVTTPSTSAAFTYGVGNIVISSTVNASVIGTWALTVDSGQISMGSPPGVESFHTILQTASPGGAQTLTLPTPLTDTLVSRTSVDTLQFKRITKRVVVTTQSATPTINTDNTDLASITGLAQAITSMTTNLSGAPVAGDELTIQITDNGTARAMTWGAKFEASTVALPTTTVINALLTVKFIWNTVTSKWRMQSVA